jgi:hypothetical protein
MRGLAVFFLLITPCALVAQEREPFRSAEIALSNDTLQVRVSADGRAVNMAGGGQVMGDLLLTEERDFVLSGALLFPADLGLDRFSFRFGPRVYAALLQEENSDVFAVSIGGTARFELNRNQRLAIVGEAFYAPDIITFGTADNLTDLMARAEIGFGDRLTGFAGMRWFEFDLTEGQGENTLQEEVFVGIGYQF